MENLTERTEQNYCETLKIVQKQNIAQIATEYQVNITEKKGWMPSVGKQSTIALEYFSKYSMCGFKHTNRLCFAFKVEMCPRTV